MLGSTLAAIIIIITIIIIIAVELDLKLNNYPILFSEVYFKRTNIVWAPVMYQVLQ